MKVVITYFSGTGNTKAIALGYQRVLNGLGHEVICQSIENITEIPNHDLLIIGGPIYAGNVPDELIIWMRKTVKKNESAKKAIVFTSSAGLQNANGVSSMGKKLIKKGYQVMDTPTFEMPRNFYIDKYDPTPEEQQIAQFEKAASLINGSITKIGSGQGVEIDQSVVMIDLLADVFRLMAKSLGKNFSISNDCIGCGKCERDCPKKNIDFKTKEYSNQCIMCTRCIHNCPVQAISYKGKFVEQYRVHYRIEV
jgi:ferredoxin